MKTYYVNYSLLSSGVLKIVANNAYEADSIASNVSTEILMRITDFSDGFAIDHILDEHGNPVDIDADDGEEEDQDQDEEEFGYIVIS
jgi:hypothetical protein